MFGRYALGRADRVPMLEVLPSLVPLLIGSAILPTWISLIVLSLRSPRGTTKALSFVSAVTAVRLLQGLGAGDLLRKAAGLVHGLESWHLIPAMVLAAGVILVGVGIHGLMRGGRRDHPHKHLSHHRWWLPRDSRRLAGVVSILIGAYLLWRGITALFGD